MQAFRGGLRVVRDRFVIVRRRFASFAT